MASKQQPPLVPRINSPPPVSNNPVKVSASDGDYFTPFELLTPAPSASPATSAFFSTTPKTLLRTPAEPLSPSRSFPRSGEVSIRSPGSSNRITRATSPSENRSSTLSPSVSSSGYSYHSSDTGYSPCSYGSSEYLTPPQFQPDGDKRPYKPRTGSGGSLIMVKKPNRANTLPHDRDKRFKRRHRHGRCRKHSCRRHGKSHLRQDTDQWWLPSCQVAPTAIKGMRGLCDGHIGTYKPLMSLRGTTDTYGRVLPRLWSDPAPPVISRRWSSVEVGSHQIHSTLPANSTTSAPDGRLQNLNGEFIRGRSSKPYRSSTFTRGAIDNDIVSTVRERLTHRKVPSPHLRTPTTITLRRASGASGMSGMSTVTQLLTPAKDPHTGGNTPRPYPTSQADVEMDAAYLITRKEIDSITELIEANLRRKPRPHNRVSAHPPVTPPGAISPNFTSKGMMPVPPSPSSAASSVTVTQANGRRSKTQDSFTYLQVASPPSNISRKASRGISRPASRNSTHEVIWEPGGGSLNSCNVTDDDDLEGHQSSSPNSLQHQLETTSVTPHPHRPESAQLPIQRSDKGDAFDPTDSRASIKEWSWRLPRAEIPTIVTSDSESNEVTPASEVPPKIKPKIPIRSVASAPDVPKSSSKRKVRTVGRPTPDAEDVVFFPLLPPRKSTNEWYSPLPDIGHSPPKSSSPQSLYMEGIDATGALSIDSLTPKPQCLPLMDQPSSATPSVEFNPHFDLRRKSTIRAHPLSPARIGSHASMGSSIGISSGERRQSSIKHSIQRVQTIDNIHKGERAGTWTRNRPPSVCPPPMSPSPAEMSDNDISRPASPPPASRKDPVGRAAINTRVQLSKMEHVGIYGKITGTVKAALGLDLETCKDGCPQKHNCDDCERDPRQPSV